MTNCIIGQYPCGRPQVTMNHIVDSCLPTKLVDDGLLRLILLMMCSHLAKRCGQVAIKALVK